MNVKKILLMTLIGTPVVNVGMVDQVLGMEKLKFADVVNAMNAKDSFFFGKTELIKFFKKCYDFCNNLRVTKDFNNKVNDVFDIYWKGNKANVKNKCSTEFEKIFDELNDVVTQVKKMYSSGSRFLVSEAQNADSEKLAESMETVFEHIRRVDAGTLVEGEFNLLYYLICPVNAWNGQYRKFINVNNPKKNLFEFVDGNVCKNYSEIQSAYFAPKRKLADAIVNAKVDAEKFLFVSGSKGLNSEQILNQIKLLCIKNGEDLHDNVRIKQFNESIRLPAGDCKDPLLSRLSRLFDPGSELRIKNSDFGNESGENFVPFSDTKKQDALWKIIASNLLGKIDKTLDAYGEEELFSKKCEFSVKDFAQEFEYATLSGIDRVFGTYCDLHNDKNKDNLKVRQLSRAFEELSKEEKNRILNCKVQFDPADKRKDSFDKLYSAIKTLKVFDNVDEIKKYKCSAFKWVTDIIKDTDDKNEKIADSEEFFEYIPGSTEKKKVSDEYTNSLKLFRLDKEGTLFSELMSLPVVVSDNDDFLDNENWKTEKFAELKKEFLKNLLVTWKSFLDAYPTQKIGINTSLLEIVNKLRKNTGTIDLLDFCPDSNVFPEKVVNDMLSVILTKDELVRNDAANSFNKVFKESICTEANVKQVGNYSLKYLHEILKKDDFNKWILEIGNAIADKRGDMKDVVNSGAEHKLTGAEFVDYILYNLQPLAEKSKYVVMEVASSAEEIKKDYNNALIQKFANAFDSEKDKIKSLDIQSEEISGDYFVKSILKYTSKTSPQDVLHVCLSFVSEEDRKAVSEKYETALNMAQKKKNEFSDMIRNISGRVSYGTLNKYFSGKKSVEEVGSEFAKSYIKNLNNKLDSYGDETGIFGADDTVGKMLSNELAFPKDVYGYSPLNQEGLFVCCSDANRNVFSKADWETIMNKKIENCDKWKRKDVSADTLMVAVNNIAATEINDRVYDVSEIFAQNDSLWCCCCKFIAVRYKDAGVVYDNIVKNNGLLRKIERQNVVIKKGENGWKSLCDHVLSNLNPNEMLGVPVKLSELREKGQIRDFTAIENKMEFIKTTDEKIWAKVLTALSLPATDDETGLQQRLEDCFCESQEIYLTGKEVTEQNVDTGLMQALSFVVDDYETEIPSTLGDAKKQNEQNVLALTIGRTGTNEYGVPIDKEKVSDKLNSNTPVPKTKLARKDLWTTSKEILTTTESGKGTRKLVDFYMNGMNKDDNAFDRWVVQSKKNSGQFDGLAVVLAEKIAADAKEEKPTLTHDKTLSVEAENIINWLNDPASKEIVDQIQITTDMNTTAENAVVALAEAFMKNETFQKINLGDLVGFQVPLVDVLKKLTSEEDRKMLFGEESEQSFDTLFDKNQPDFQDNCLKFIKFASHKLATDSDKDFVDNELRLNADMYKPFTEALWLPLGYEFFDRVFVGDNAVKGLFQKKDNNDEHVDLKNPESLSNVKNENKDGLLQKYLERFLQRVNNSLESFKNEKIFTGENVRGIDVVEQLGMDLNEFDQVDPDALPLNKQGLKRILNEKIDCDRARSTFFMSFTHMCFDKYSNKNGLNENRCSLLDIMKCKYSVFYKIIKKISDKYLATHGGDTEKNVSFDHFVSWLFGTDCGMEVLNEKICFSSNDDIDKLSSKIFEICCLNGNFSLNKFIAVKENDENYEHVFGKYKEKCSEFVENCGLNIDENDKNIATVLRDVFTPKKFDESDNQLCLNLENCVDNVLYARFLKFKEDINNKSISNCLGDEPCYIYKLLTAPNNNILDSFIFDNKIRNRVVDNPALFWVPQDNKIGAIVSFLKYMNCGISVDEINKDNSSVLPDEMNYLSETNKRRFEIVGNNVNNIHDKLTSSFDSKTGEVIRLNSSLHEFLCDSCSTVVPNLHQLNDETLKFKLVMSELFKKNGLMNKFFGCNSINSVGNEELSYDKIVVDIMNIESLKRQKYRTDQIFFSVGDNKEKTKENVINGGSVNYDGIKMKSNEKMVNTDSDKNMREIMDCKQNEMDDKEERLVVTDNKLKIKMTPEKEHIYGMDEDGNNEIIEENKIANEEKNDFVKTVEGTNSIIEKIKIIDETNDNEVVRTNELVPLNNINEIVLSNERTTRENNTENAIKNEEKLTEHMIVSDNMNNIMSHKENDRIEIDENKSNLLNVDGEEKNDILDKNEFNDGKKESITVTQTATTNPSELIPIVRKKYPNARFVNLEDRDDCPCFDEVLKEFPPETYTRFQVLNAFSHYSHVGDIDKAINIVYPEE